MINVLVRTSLTLNIELYVLGIQSKRYLPLILHIDTQVNWNVFDPSSKGGYLFLTVDPTKSWNNVGI